MKCNIHRYARNLYDIARLEEMIGLNKAKSARELMEIRKYNQGREDGFLEGAINIARKLMEVDGIDHACEISGFSREKILNGL